MSLQSGSYSAFSSSVFFFSSSVSKSRPSFVTHLIFWTMFDSMMKALDEDRDFYDMFILLFGETLTGFLAILVSAFWGFHIWLMLRAMSTIEFCEKQMKTSKTSYASVYDRGVYGNIQEVLGVSPFFMVASSRGLCG